MAASSDRILYKFSTDKNRSQTLFLHNACGSEPGIVACFK